MFKFGAASEPWGGGGGDIRQAETEEVWYSPVARTFLPPPPTRANTTNLTQGLAA